MSRHRKEINDVSCVQDEDTEEVSKNLQPLFYEGPLGLRSWGVEEWRVVTRDRNGVKGGGVTDNGTPRCFLHLLTELTDDNPRFSLQLPPPHPISFQALAYY